MKEDLQTAYDWVRNGGECHYQYGMTYKGARSRKIDNEKAKELLATYRFGIGFYELRWSKNDQEDTILVFNEYSENDMY